MPLRRGPPTFAESGWSCDRLMAIYGVFDEDVSKPVLPRFWQQNNPAGQRESRSSCHMMVVQRLSSRPQIPFIGGGI